MNKRLQKKGRAFSQLGVNLIEASLTLPVLLLVIFSTIDVARYQYTSNMLQAAVQRGVLLASVVPDLDSTDEAKQRDALDAIQNETLKVVNATTLSSTNFQASDINIELPPAGNYGNDLKSAMEAEPLKVSTTATFHFVNPFLPAKTIGVEASRFREQLVPSSVPIPTDCYGNRVDTGLSLATGYKVAQCPCSISLPRSGGENEYLSQGQCVCKSGYTRLTPGQYFGLMGNYDAQTATAQCRDWWDRSTPLCRLNTSMSSGTCFVDSIHYSNYLRCRDSVPCITCGSAGNGCLAGQISSTSSSGSCSCTTCAAGTVPNASRTACVCAAVPSCGPGMGLSSTGCSCVACPAGEFSIVNAAGKCACNTTMTSTCASRGMLASTSTCSCIPCAANMEFNSTTKACVCKTGDGYSSAASCAATGLSFNSATCSCIPCGQGKTLVGGVCKCTIAAGSCDSGLQLNPTSCACEPIVVDE